MIMVAVQRPLFEFSSMKVSKHDRTHSTSAEMQARSTRHQSDVWREVSIGMVCGGQ